ncbi:hypothetical protein DQ237_10290 [Blastococcus sp. TF02-8]|uniref:hypothetical protein n=1 Tax=Blastococcus sp. TF02-8 TaxID=2250574 RepID=UPI000DEB3E07|nr:hypothetical protein [Blastococcus sp. TF02-8]RBY96242.1 hypothetical protein DQ237_10290 [Blastococcus sp. TF02-8]
MALLVAVLGVVGVVGVRASGGPDERTTAAWGTSALVLPVIPVGGQLTGGRQTLDSALATVEGAAAAGATGVQMTADVHWLCAEDPCDTAPLEPVVTRAGELGLSVYLHVVGTPEWMDDRGRWYAPEGEDAERWAGLFAQFVDAFGTRVAGYEVWNEPNNEEFWRQGPDPGSYADLLKASWLSARDRDPDARLVGGVLSNNDLGYMSALSAALAERGGNADNRFFYDDLGVHPYTGDESRGFAPNLPAGSADVRVPTGVKDMTFLGVERLREQVAEDEGLWRDVVIGEFGYDTTPGAWYSVPEPQRAGYMAEALRRASSWTWVRSFTPYTYNPAVGEGFGIDGTPTDAALRDVAAESW